MHMFSLLLLPECKYFCTWACVKTWRADHVHRLPLLDLKCSQAFSVEKRQWTNYYLPLVVSNIVKRKARVKQKQNHVPWNIGIVPLITYSDVLTSSGKKTAHNENPDLYEYHFKNLGIHLANRIISDSSSF